MKKRLRIWQKNYLKNVQEVLPIAGDIIAHDGLEPFFVYDGKKTFLKIFRSGTTGKLKVSLDYHENLQCDFYEPLTFYRFEYIGNLKDGIRLRNWTDRLVYGQIIPKNILKS
jgi:hypothetical protein